MAPQACFCECHDTEGIALQIPTKTAPELNGDAPAAELEDEVAELDVVDVVDNEEWPWEEPEDRSGWPITEAMSVALQANPGRWMRVATYHHSVPIELVSAGVRARLNAFWAVSHGVDERGWGRLYVRFMGESS